MVWYSVVVVILWTIDCVFFSPVEEIIHRLRILDWLLLYEVK